MKKLELNQIENLEGSAPKMITHESGLRRTDILALVFIILVATEVYILWWVGFAAFNLICDN